MIVLAIDPGKAGGIACMSPNITGGTFIQAWVMPMAGNVPNTAEIRRIIEDSQPDLVVIEQVHSMPGQGVSSTFTFGRGFGRLETIVEMLRIPHELVTPQRWKKTVLNDTAKDKAAAVEYVQRRFPGFDLIQPRCRTPHDGIADAICMAAAGLVLFGDRRAA